MIKPGTRFGPYEIISPLGRGGMGEVYRAKDVRLGREVAIKVLVGESASDPQRLMYFEREARAASALNHPNIITIYDIGQIDSAHYIAMELVEGKTLRDILALGPLPTKKTLHIAAQVADGLAKAHAAGILHRDLKPENLVITNDGAVKILDFGLAKLAEPRLPANGASHAPTLASASQPGLILGTVGYMSPEQAAGLPADFRSDQFSFGAILYETATGKRAFQRETAVETLSAIIRDEPEPVAAINPMAPAPFRWVVERCLAKNPEDRYASTRDLARDLHSLHEHIYEVETSNVALLSVARPSARATRFRILASVGVVIGFLIALAGGYFLGRRARGALPTFRQLTFRRGNISGARLAPDGRTVVYGATWVGKGPELYILRAESPESGSLALRGAGILSISSSAEMAVVLGCRLNWGECIGTLARIPLTGGAPRELLKHVHDADWAPDGKTLAAVELTEKADRLEYPIGTVLYETEGWITSPRVSPKGDQIAFLDHSVLGDIAGSVCVIDLNGKKRTLSGGWKGLKGLAWSRRGDEVWFSGSRVSKSGGLGLYAVTLSGKERLIFPSPGILKVCDISREGERVLLMRGNLRGGVVGLGPTDPKEQDLSWFDQSTVADLAADGRTLLFYEWGEGVGGTFTVYLRKTDGSDAVRLGEGRPLALSPDGRWAVAVQQTSPPQLIALPTGPGEQKVLPRGAIQEYLDWAAWAPDSHRILFAAQDKDGHKRTYLQDIDGGLPHPVAPEGMVGTLLSPDGKLIAAVDRYGEYHLCPIEGGEPQPLVGYQEGDLLLQWSADGRSVFVRQAGNLTLRIYKLGLSDGRRVFWKELLPPDRATLIDIGSDPGQVRITPDGRFYAYTYWTLAGELYLAEGLR